MNKKSQLIELVKLYNLLSYYFTMTNQPEINTYNTVKELIDELKKLVNNKGETQNE